MGEEREENVPDTEMPVKAWAERKSMVHSRR